MSADREGFLATSYNDLDKANRAAMYCALQKCQEVPFAALAYYKQTCRTVCSLTAQLTTNPQHSLL